jgi:hypothetical protein
VAITSRSLTLIATEKLVDGDFLARLTANSMESVMGAVDEVVTENAALFGGTSDTVRTIATYPSHLIVVNEDGEFYRAKWSRTDNGGVVLSEIEEIDVPVYDARSLGPQVRQESVAAAKALLNGDMDTADEKLRGLYRLVKSGVRLTAEGVEDLYHQQMAEDSDWVLALRERAEEIRTFLGTDAIRIESMKPRFESLLDGSVTEQQAEPQRTVVADALGRLSSDLVTMRTRIALAKQVTEGHKLRGDEKAESGPTAADFVDFVSSFSEDLDAMIGVLGDAQVVAEDGCIKCLARLHDGLSARMYEWGLATAFCEKLARRFALA